MFVKIIHGGYWYGDCVGEVFEVDEKLARNPNELPVILKSKHNNDTWSRIDKGPIVNGINNELGISYMHCWIAKSDCIVQPLTNKEAISMLESNY